MESKPGRRQNCKTAGIAGKSYELGKPSNEAKSQLGTIRAVDATLHALVTDGHHHSDNTEGPWRKGWQKLRRRSKKLP